MRPVRCRSRVRLVQPINRIRSVALRTAVLLVVAVAHRCGWWWWTERDQLDDGRK